MPFHYHLRAFGRTIGLLALSAAVVPAQLLVAGPLFRNRKAVSSFFGSAFRRIMGIKVEFNGVAVKKDRPMLYMANHFSVLDPFIMMKINKNAGGVAMKKLGKWPLLGRFAKSLGTVFASNDTPGQRLSDIHEQLTEQLNEGRSIVFCPEGMIKDGKTVVPFRTGIIKVGFNNLASKPLERDIGYQAFALDFKKIDGKDPNKHPEVRDIIRPINKKVSLSQVWKMLGARSIEATMTVLPSLEAKDFKNAKELADTARAQIISALG